MKKQKNRKKTKSSFDIHELFKPRLPKGFYYQVFHIQNWKKWDEEIDMAVNTFKKKYPVYPNILLASSQTLKMFDMAAFTLHPENLIYAGPPEEEPPEPILEPDGGIYAFNRDEYILVFCLLEEAPLGYFVLVYDSDPDGGEDLPDFGFKDLTLRGWQKQVAG